MALFSGEAPKKQESSLGWRRFAAGAALGSVVVGGGIVGIHSLSGESAPNPSEENSDDTEPRDASSIVDAQVPPETSNNESGESEVVIDEQDPYASTTTNLHDSRIAMTQLNEDGSAGELLIQSKIPMNFETPSQEIAEQLGLLSKLTYCDYSQRPNLPLLSYTFGGEQLWADKWKEVDALRTDPEYDPNDYCIVSDSFSAQGEFTRLANAIDGQVRYDYETANGETVTEYYNVTYRYEEHGQYTIRSGIEEGEGWKILHLNRISEEDAPESLRTSTESGAEEEGNTITATEYVADRESQTLRRKIVRANGTEEVYDMEDTSFEGRFRNGSLVIPELEPTDDAEEIVRHSVFLSDMAWCIADGELEGSHSHQLLDAIFADNASGSFAESQYESAAYQSPKTDCFFYAYEVDDVRSTSSTMTIEYRMGLPGKEPDTRLLMELEQAQGYSALGGWEITRLDHMDR